MDKVAEAGRILPGREKRGEVRGRRSEVRGQKSEVRGQRSEVRSQLILYEWQKQKVRIKGSTSGRPFNPDMTSDL
jgi:hypothetical protein